jgi:hypothetical protein
MGIADDESIYISLYSNMHFLLIDTFSIENLYSDITLY